MSLAFAMCARADRKSTRLNSSHGYISYAVFCLKKKQNSRLSTGPSSRGDPFAVSSPPPRAARGRAGGRGPCVRVLVLLRVFFFFFFNDTATTEIYTLSLHDALPISHIARGAAQPKKPAPLRGLSPIRSEEHTSELQSRLHLVCRLLLEKKNKQT